MRLRALLFGAAFLVATLAFATTVIPMSVEELTKSAEHVVQARAIEQWSAWAPDHGLILTYTRFQLLSTMKGGLPATFVVKQMGGRVGEQRTHVAGIRYFNSNDEAVLFLHPAAEKDSTYVIAGLMMGNFHVDRSSGTALVSNGVPDVHAFSTVTHSVSSYQGSKMTLDELQTRVRQAVRR
jgi:hypothetical protein